MGRTVAIVNQKGGVGKTTVTLGLASAAAAAGDRVLVVDLDPQASASWVLGIDPDDDDRPTASGVDGAPAQPAIVASTWGDAIDVLPGPPVGAGWLGPALANVEGRYRAVLLDCPPSLGALTTSALTVADHALVVVEPSALGLRGIGGIADLIDDVWHGQNPQLDLAGVIVNKVPGISAEAERRYEELVAVIGRKAVWSPVVAHRVVMAQALGERRPIHSYGARSRDVCEALDRLWSTTRRLRGR